MSALSKRIAELEARLGVELEADWRRWHMRAQLTRLAAGVVTTVLWAVLHGGVSDWTDVVPLLGTAVWTTLEQMWPQVPWKLLRDRLANRPPAASAGG